jgi:hypothetical protein
MVHAPAFSPQPHIDPRTAILPLVLGDFPDPGSQRGILLASAAIPERLAIEGQEPAYPPLTRPTRAAIHSAAARFALGATSFLR